MRKHEKKSFFTIFSISFITLLALGSIIAYYYYEENKDHIEENILYQMKDYTFDFKDKKFDLEIVKKKDNIKFFNIYEEANGLYAYFKFPKDDKYILKVKYSREKFNKELKPLIDRTIKLSLLALLFILIFSASFAYFAIKPMKKAVNLLEVFLKDLIHDLNTPVTSILLNTKLLARKEESEELERIELSATTIASLYKNLEILSKEQIRQNDEIDIKALIEHKIATLKKLFPKIEFTRNLSPLHINSDKDSISRILDNILTNACKYNKKRGKVIITTTSNTIVVQDTGIGIKNPQKIFDRYYKENERGLGIGMNIVKRLCDELNIQILIQSKIDKGTTIKLILN